MHCVSCALLSRSLSKGERNCGSPRWTWNKYLTTCIIWPTFDALLRKNVYAAIVAVLRRMSYIVKGYVSLWAGADSRTFDIDRK